MAPGGRPVSNADSLWVVTALGASFVLLALGRVATIASGGDAFPEAPIDFVLLGVPGLALLYGAHWLRRTAIDPEVYPRIVAWCLGGFVALLGVSVVMMLNPGGTIDRPLRAATIAAGIGAGGGLGIGLNEARAILRAREAEGHRDELRVERNLRERIVETSPVGISVVNADRTTELANERAAEIVGLSRADLLELEYDESMLETTDEGGETLEEGVFERVLRTGDPVYDAERQMTRPDGRRIWLSVNGAPLFGPSGEVSAVIFAVTDITEQKRLEADLTETVGRLERSNDRLRQFAYAASHDLQEPLRMVSSYVQLIEARYADDLDEDARDFIEFAVDGADRMRRMVQDLLAYSQLERADREFEPVDCEAVLERVRTDLQVQIRRTDAEIHVDPLPTVRADENQLNQLFQNLVSNALKYSGDAPPRVAISAEELYDRWEFSVADDGIGIEADSTDRIFEVFKRLHGDDEYSGTGIGLALCQRIVDHHGGRIWVESEPGEGSTFYFTLPDDDGTESGTTA